MQNCRFVTVFQTVDFDVLGWNMNLKKYLTTKGFGFWLSVAVALVGLVFAVVYQVTYCGTEEYSVVCFVAALIVCVATLAFTALRLDGFVAVAQLLSTLLGFGFFAYANYYYVSVVIVGIDAASFSARFIFCCVAYLLLIVGSAVNVFCQQAKRCVNCGETSDVETSEVTQ